MLSIRLFTKIIVFINITLLCCCTEIKVDEENLNNNFQDNEISNPIIILREQDKKRVVAKSNKLFK